ncbi:MAG: hypothetical protein MHM6MM_009580 [Cercozoa sp. M6MM]
MRQAYTALSRALLLAGHGVVALPARAYERDGGVAFCRSLLRGVPSAVLRSMAGASEALSRAMASLRNQLDPEGARERRRTYKSRQ